MSRQKATADFELIDKGPKERVLVCKGEWVTQTIGECERRIRKFRFQKGTTLTIDLSAVSKIDTLAALLFITQQQRMESEGCSVTAKGASPKTVRIYRLVLSKIPKKIDRPKASSALVSIFESIGRRTVEDLRDTKEFFAFLGRFASSLFGHIKNPSSFRFGALVKSIETDGLSALPIVGITAFLVGIVVAYQAAVQLEKFGANLFIADMVFVSVTRELAPLIVAIVIAGRSGSAYTAQLGAMKMTEEIDAMRTMGFNPFSFLVAPRIIGLILSLPLLIVFADIIAIAAGALVAQLQLHLSWREFVQRIYDAVPIRHFYVGLIKAPFFAFLIASIGCFRGFQTSGNTQSVGRFTTISVVNSIFAVIICDALFSILLTRMKL